MRRLSALTVAILASTGAAASGFQLNNPELNAMGGAGVSSSAFANPALVTPVRGRQGFDLTLGSVSFYLEDPEGLGTSFKTFLENDFDQFLDYDSTALVGTLEPLQAAIDDYVNSFVDDDAEIEAARKNLVEKRDATQEELDNTDRVVDATRGAFVKFSDKAVNVGLLSSLGLMMPEGNVPFRVSAENNAFTGVEFNLEENDLNRFTNVTEDSSDFLQRLDALIELENDSDLEDARTARDTVREDSPNKIIVFVEGDPDDPNDPGKFVFDDSSLTDDPTSTIDILGANITELSFGSGIDYPNNLGNLSIGATAKLQYWQVFGETIGYEDRDTIDASFIQNNTQAYFTGNLDLGIAQSFTGTGYGTFGVAAVVKDLVPQSFESGDGRTIDVGPKLRAGVSHQTRFTLLTADIDVTENAPIGHGVDSRYLGLGAQLNAWDYAQLRVGYRNNLSVNDASIVSAGIGLTPWVAALDISGWVKPNAEDEVDLALNAGFSMDLGIRF